MVSDRLSQEAAARGHGHPRGTGEAGGDAARLARVAARLSEILGAPLAPRHALICRRFAPLVCGRLARAAEPADPAPRLRSPSDLARRGANLARRDPDALARRH